MDELEVSTIDGAGQDPANTAGRLENRIAHAIAGEIGALSAQFQNQFITANKFLIEVEVRCANLRALLQNLAVRQSIARAETLMLRAALSDCAERISQMGEAMKTGMAARGAGPNGEGD